MIAQSKSELKRLSALSGLPIEQIAQMKDKKELRRAVMRREQAARRADPVYMRHQAHAGEGAVLFTTMNEGQVAALEDVFAHMATRGWVIPRWLGVLKKVAIEDDMGLELAFAATGLGLPATVSQ
jgi:hypothetical protein